MAIPSTRIIEITEEVIKLSFFNYFLGREEVDTKHAILAKFFPNESVIGSAITGLSTSLGSFWEKIAVKLAIENNFTVLNPKVDFLQPNFIPSEIFTLISKNHQKRMAPNANVSFSVYQNDIDTEIKKITLPNNIIFKTLEKGSGIDLLLQKNNNLYAYDLKTVQINASGGALYSERLMKWYAYDAISQKVQNKKYKFHPHIVIPYDPHTHGNWWDNFQGRVYPLDKTDLKLCNDFWDFLTDTQNSFQYIETAIDNLVKSGLPKIYHPSLYKADVIRSFEILKNTCNIAPIDSNISPSSFAEKIEWKCLGCSFKFKQSIRWFERNTICPRCNGKFLT